MKILMLVNWKVEYCEMEPKDRQPPDYYVSGKPYWFYRYFSNVPDVDVVDISSFRWLERFEKNTIRFYLWQTLKVLPRLNKYDLIVSHGMQSGVVLSLWRRFFKTKAKHIIFDIGSFNSAAESGFALKLMQFASKSIDGIIYHTSRQMDYYKSFFPWIVKKSEFIRFGTDLDFFNPGELKTAKDKDNYIISVGYAKRDWDTVVEAYKCLNTDIKLRLVGHVDLKYQEVKGVEQIEFVPIRDLINHIYNAKFCVLPLEVFNYSYGQMTLMQQMALEKAVIVARVPSVIDYVEDGITAILYEPKNANDLFHKMGLLIDNDMQRQEIALEGKRYLCESCNEEIMAKQIENFLNSFDSKR